MAEEDISTDTAVDSKPFFAIDAEDIAKAAAEAPSPPTPVMIGTFGESSSSETAGSAWGAPTPQMTGNINAQQSQHVFNAPQPYQKNGIRWGQFFLGFFIPLGVVFIMFLVETTFLQWDDDVWRSESRVVESTDGTTFEVQFETLEGERVEAFWTSFEYENDTVEINCWHSYSDGESDVFQYRNYDDGTVVGVFYSSNNTAFFQLESATVGELSVQADYYNEEMDFQAPPGDAAFDFVCCLLPFAYIFGIIGAFATGRKALGFGMMCSSLVVVLPFVFFIIALAALP